MEYVYKETANAIHLSLFLLAFYLHILLFNFIAFQHIEGATSLSKI